MADAEQIQKAYTAILQHVVQTGRAPHHTELALALGTTPDQAKELQEAAAAAAASCWISADTDYVQSWAPFSNIPTQYLVSVDGVQKWYGQGGLEALAVRWLFPGSEVRIDARCLDCAEPMLLRFRDEELLEKDPSGLVAHFNVPLPKWGEVTWSFNGMRMNLFRSEEHAKAWSLYDPASEEAIMPVEDWAKVFGGRMFKHRLDSDYLSRVGEYRGDFGKTLFGELGKTGPFFRG